MKNFTKIIKIAMAILLVFGFASCKNQSGNTGGTNPPKPNPETFVITFSNPAHGKLTAKRADGTTESLSVLPLKLIMRLKLGVEQHKMAQTRTKQN